MPCRDYYDDHPEEYYRDTLRGLKDQVSFAESALCMMVKAMESIGPNGPTPMLSSWTLLLDFEDAGIKKEEFFAWVKKHKALDEKHRRKEQKEKLKKQALEKLNPAEREALGFK